jgi:hypothetical protein
MPATIHMDDVPAELTRKLGLPRKPKAGAFTKDRVRSWSLRVLALMADLTQAERARVLVHAARVNKLYGDDRDDLDPDHPALPS